MTYINNCSLPFELNGTTRTTPDGEELDEVITKKLRPLLNQLTTTKPATPKAPQPPRPYDLLRKLEQELRLRLPVEFESILPDLSKEVTTTQQAIDILPNVIGHLFRSINSSARSSYKGICYLNDWIPGAGMKYVAVTHPGYWSLSSQTNPDNLTPQWRPFDQFEERLQESMHRLTLPSVSAFCAKPGVPAKKALDAFLDFAVADCATVLQAVLFGWLYSIVGEETFNQTFSSPLCPLSLTPFTLHTEYSCFGNPIASLYQYISPKEKFQVGDLVYFRNTLNYPKKHPLGDSTGFNVICVGDDLFLGFGDNFREGPLTSAQLVSYLLEKYELESTEEEKAYIHKHQLVVEPITDSVEITHALRLNQAGLKLFMKKTFVSWGHRPLTDFILPINEEIKPSFFVDVPHENQSLTIANTALLADNKDAEIARSFIHHLQRSRPIGLILKGANGLGKSSLAVAIGAAIEQQGCKVKFYTRKSDLKFTPPDADLIILDDFNTTFGAGRDFLSQMINWALKNNKGFVLTTNADLDTLLSDPIEIAWTARAFLPREDADLLTLPHRRVFAHTMTGSSHRTNWWKGVRAPTIDDLLNFDGPAGILVTGLSESAIQASIGSRCSQVLVFNFDQSYEADSFTIILQDAWEHNKKVIAIIPDLKNQTFTEYFLSGLRATPKGDYNRLKARLAVMFNQQ